METAAQNIREFYGEKKNYVKVLEEYDGVNDQLDWVEEKVTCYRYELGQLLGQVKQHFRKIIEKVMNENIVREQVLIKQKQAVVEDAWRDALRALTLPAI